MKRSTVSVVLALVAVVVLVSVAHAVPREEIVLTTIIPDQQVLMVKKGVVGYNYRRACAKDPDNYVKNSDLLIEGNVGIGTTELLPHGKVQIASFNVPLVFRETDETGAGSLWHMALDSKHLRFDVSLDGVVFGEPETGFRTPLDLYSNGNVVLSGSGGGNVGIGTADPWGKLGVHSNTSQGTIAISGVSDGATYSALYLHDDTTDVNNTWVMAFKKGPTAANLNSLHITRFDTAGATITPLAINTSGDISGTHGNYHPSSDIRRKKDIVTIPNALDKVLALRGVNFKWREPSQGDDHLQMGMIAQEVEKVTPEVVHTADDEMKTKAVEYQFMIGLLIEAMKEQQKAMQKQEKISEEQQVQIDNLKSEKDAEIKQLKAEIAALKQKIGQ